MSLILFSSTTLFAPYAFSAPSSSGPASVAQAKLLWAEGKNNYDTSNWLEAKNNFQRLIDRYPASPGFIEAHWLLGKSYLKLHEPKAAIDPLKYFVGARGFTDEALECRLDLARAYLEIQKYDEAVLTSGEIVHRGNKKPVKMDVLGEALLIQSEGLIYLGQDFKAERALADAKKQISSENKLYGKSLWVEFQYRMRQCSKFPSSKILKEDQVQDQLSRKGDCLLQSTLLFKKITQNQMDAFLEKGQEQIESEYENLFSTANHPPHPPEKRTAKELQAYESELRDVLIKKAREKTSTAIDFLKEDLDSASAPGQKSLTKIREKLEKLGS